MRHLIAFIVTLALAGSASAGSQAAAEAPEKKTPAPAKPALTAEQEARIVRHPLLARMSTVGERPQLRGGAKGAAPWVKHAFPAGAATPVTLRLPGGAFRAYADPEARRLWVAGAILRESRTVLRLGDLLPLLAPAGIADREAALAVTRVAVAGGGAPPNYSLTFRTGALWPHREKLAAAEAAGRVRYSLATGRVVVLRHLVVADAAGDLAALPVPKTEHEDVERLGSRLLPKTCAPLEAAMRSGKTKPAQAPAKKLLATPNVAQTCAARFFAATRPAGAAATLREALGTARLGWPGAVVEALAALEPAPSEVNVKAAAAMIARRGVPGATAVCQRAPIAWTDALLARKDLAPGVRRVLERCAYQ